MVATGCTSMPWWAHCWVSICMCACSWMLQCPCKASHSSSNLSLRRQQTKKYIHHYMAALNNLTKMCIIRRFWGQCRTGRSALLKCYSHADVIKFLYAYKLVTNYIDLKFPFNFMWHVSCKTKLLTFVWRLQENLWSVIQGLELVEDHTNIWHAHLCHTTVSTDKTQSLGYHSIANAMTRNIRFHCDWKAKTTFSPAKNSEGRPLTGTILPSTFLYVGDGVVLKGLGEPANDGLSGPKPSPWPWPLVCELDLGGAEEEMT